MWTRFSWILVAFTQVISSEIQSYLPDDLECYGYEEDCVLENSYSKDIQCENDADIETFYNEADFGYVKYRLDTMQTF